MEEHNSTCLSNTRTELLCQMREWANDKNSRPIFWLNGVAGTGKSTIARTTARTFADQQRLGASLFFKRSEGERGNATRFFTMIAIQLAMVVLEIRAGINKVINADPALSEKALKDQLEKSILHPLLEASNIPALILLTVIDALDECEQDSEIRAILQLLSRMKDLHLESLRIFVTSRSSYTFVLDSNRCSVAYIKI
jgi:archaellum biogenesis ATPase FlaH